MRAAVAPAIAARFVLRQCRPAAAPTLACPLTGANLLAVRRSVLLYGLLTGLLIAVLKTIEYRYVVVQPSFEVYGALVALLFASLGIWLGLKFTGRKERIVVKEVASQAPEQAAPKPFVVNEKRLEQLGVTPRELEILQLIAAGLSTREISERLFVSENTVKTHSSRLFSKLDARRRTQAVQRAKEAGLIP